MPNLKKTNDCCEDENQALQSCIATNSKHELIVYNRNYFSTYSFASSLIIATLFSVTKVNSNYTLPINRLTNLNFSKIKISKNSGTPR